MEDDTAVLDDIIQENKEVSDFSKVVDTLTNNRYWRRKTILRNRQVSKLTTLDVLGQIYDVAFLKQWVPTFTEFSTSGDSGRGRKDIVDISKFHYASKYNDKDNILQDLRR